MAYPSLRRQALHPVAEALASSFETLQVASQEEVPKPFRNAQTLRRRSTPQLELRFLMQIASLLILLVVVVCAVGLRLLLLRLNVPSGIALAISIAFVLLVMGRLTM